MDSPLAFMQQEASPINSPSLLCGHTESGGEVHAMYTDRETFLLKVLQEAVNTLDFGLA
jgi:hypothetical protein